jgi:hypothetical protein
MQPINIDIWRVYLYWYSPHVIPKSTDRTEIPKFDILIDILESLIKVFTTAVTAHRRSLSLQSGAAFA